MTDNPTAGDMDEFLPRVQANAKVLMGLYQEQRSHMAFARGLDECLAAESRATARIASTYRDSLAGIKFLSPRYFEQHQGFVRSQEITREFLLDGLPHSPIFVSHRWETPLHPDPSGRQFRALRARLAKMEEDERASAGVWYDYCCVPQRDAAGNRTEVEQREFESLLKVIHILPVVAPVIVLFSEGYLDRSWCCSEWMFATRIIPVLLEPDEIFPFGNAVKFRHMALVSYWLKATPDFRKRFVEGDDDYAMPFINSLLMSTMRSTDCTYLSDKHDLQGMLHRHFWYHVRLYGLRSQMMTGFLLLDRYPEAFQESLFLQFLFLSGDAEMEWMKSALIDMDLMVLINGDEFEGQTFHKMEIEAKSHSSWLGDDPSEPDGAPDGPPGGS